MSNRWVLGARLRTLPASVVPVAVGTGVAAAGGHVVGWRAGLAAVVALALQVGTNYANDYSDGVRGTDEVRVGPTRLVASGLASPGAVKRAALLAFAVAGVAGLVLAATVSWWLLAVGAASVAAGWLYTGGPRPYGYDGLGELFVFVFFGLVATVGTAYVQLERITALAWVAAVVPGLLAVALLVVNNLRDIHGDAAAGKRTLAVRVGAPATRIGYALCLGLPFVAAVGIATAFRPWALLALLALPLAVGPMRAVLAGAKGGDLIAVLGATGRVQLVVGALLTIGLAV
ncbi:1,4-dihydroxy-2-naphthoate polyprenyltransferase [Acidimicrobiaceae bacterium USS-CC1]|uniref:1,4-dihydroxy-2-naphthoate octaprenyltransferase n=1 Tax=Acidiferrimicrobium australe TaxID=2664430 RepID=A0ABW9QRG5_9ACTN|nr:1,4-dihydroxy-2-naphthoate polyprenyltransferase [Acidiferrimicrobium australe]